jgi:hypothetical protein
MRSEEQIRRLAKHHRDGLRDFPPNPNNDDVCVIKITRAVTKALEWAAGDDNSMSVLLKNMDEVDAEESARIN